MAAELGCRRSRSCAPRGDSKDHMLVTVPLDRVGITSRSQPITSGRGPMHVDHCPLTSISICVSSSTCSSKGSNRQHHTQKTSTRTVWQDQLHAPAQLSGDSAHMAWQHSHSPWRQPLSPSLPPYQHHQSCLLKRTALTIATAHSSLLSPLLPPSVNQPSLHPPSLRRPSLHTSSLLSLSTAPA
jgi:hypothetical protein